MKILLTISTILLSFFYSSLRIGQENTSFKRAQQTGKAQLTYMYIGANGFVSETSQGTVSGLLVDVMQEFEKYVQKNYSISVESSYQLKKDIHFKEFLSQVSDSPNGAFGLHTTTIKEERKQFLAFSPAFLNNISVLVSHRSVPMLSKLSSISDEFEGLKAYTLHHSTYEKTLLDLKKNSFVDLELAYTPSVYDLLDKIVEDHESFAVVDISFYLEYVKGGKPLKRHPVGDKGGEQYGIVMPLGSDWQPVLAEFMNSGFLASPTYRQLVIKHLGKAALRMIDSM